MDKSRKPNILFLIVDEFRYPVHYETEELVKWRRDNLKFYTMLSKKGTVFHKHYTNTNACVPSRTTIQTGQYPSVHGNNMTNGVAKTHCNGLKPYTTPTIGNYLKKAGYKCYLKGKWHISEVDIKGLSTYDVNGKRNLKGEKIYLEKNVLSKYGYKGWIGPEPHGPVGFNTASSLPKPKIGRDEKFTQQTLELLESLEQTITPWYACINLLDPHDIALYGLFSTNSPKNFEFEIDGSLPEKMFIDEFNNSLNETLDTKPKTQKYYRDLYGKAFQPTLEPDKHIRMYYTLMKRVDRQLTRIWNKLITMPDYKNTVIIFTSDHGELLASHGNMHQKWYQAYEESIHVPLIISSPLFGNKHKDIYELTSHIDLLPTLIDIIGENQEKLRKKLSKRFSLALNLPGTSLIPLIKDEKYQCRPVYFYTEDHITKGDKQCNAVGCTYNEVPEPTCVEAIITIINGELWKYTSYYSLDPTHRDLSDIKHEIYNLSVDPLELNNLYQTINPVINQALINLLDKHTIEYRVVKNL